MTDWIDDLKPYTKFIKIDPKNKQITLIHPHWKAGQFTFRQFLKHLKQNKYNGFNVSATGFISIKGIVILKMIERYLNKLDIVESAKASPSISSAMYGLEVKFK